MTTAETMPTNPAPADLGAACRKATATLTQERLRQGLPLPFPDDDAHGVFGPADPHARTFEQEWLRFRALINTRPAWPDNDGLLAAQDALLRRISAIRGTAGLDAIAPSPADPRIGIWWSAGIGGGATTRWPMAGTVWCCWNWAWALCSAL